LAPQAGGQDQASHSNLLGALRAWRSETARKRGVPAYVVLHDSTIDGIAALRPTTLTALRAIPGIGDKKLEHYGDALVALVQAAPS
jgi:ATP-dependent DNA helicase RecQ